ncbi:MAG: hypothetical protein AB1633_13950, partial [Elusimicrobiota bacterium]
KIKTPLKYVLSNDKIILPFNGILTASFVLDNLSGTVKKGDFKLQNGFLKTSLVIVSSETNFTAELLCSSELGSLSGHNNSLNGNYLDLNISLKNGNFIELKKLEGGVQNIPVAFKVEGRSKYLLSNPVSNISGKLSFNSPDSYVVFGNSQFRGNASFDFKIERLAWNKKMLDFFGHLNLQDFYAQINKNLFIQKADGCIKLHQRVDFSKLDIASIGNIPKINFSSLGNFDENPIKIINYREIDNLYSERQKYCNKIFIPKISISFNKDYVFDSITTELSYENNILDVRHFEMKAFNGSMVGRARIHFNDGRIFYPESLRKNIEYDFAFQFNGLNYDWFERGHQGSNYYQGRNYEIDIIGKFEGRDLSDFKNLNFSGNIYVPFIGPRIATTFFRTYIDPQNKMKILSTVNSFLSRGANIENIEFVIANGRFGVTINFWPAGKFEVPRRNPISNIMEMISLQLKS